MQTSTTSFAGASHTNSFCQARFPKQQGPTYVASDSCTALTHNREREGLQMQPSPAEQTLNTALAGHAQHIPGFHLVAASLADKLQHLLDKGLSISTPDRKEVLTKFLRHYANPLPPQQRAIAFEILGTAVKESGTVKLNAKTWAFGLKRDFPSKSHGLEHGRCRGTTGSYDLTIINSISWEDQDCKSYDTALSRYWLCETIMQAKSESAIYWCWAFCKEFVAQAKKLGNRATLPQMEGQTIKIDVWGHRQWLTVVELWDELEESWRKLLQDWQNYVLASGASREGRGLQDAQDVYNEGASMALLRQAVGEWSPRPHVIKYIVKEGDVNDVKVAHEQDSRNNKKRKAHTLNGYTSSQGHLQAAAAVATQQDEQPECSTAPRSAGPGGGNFSDAVHGASIAGTALAEQVAYVVVDVNGMSCRMHPADAVLYRAAAVPQQMPGAPMSVGEPCQSNDATASAAVDGEVDCMQILTSDFPWDHILQGSVRLNVRLADMSQPAQQSTAIHQLLTAITDKYGIGCAFTMTVAVAGSVLNFTKLAGISPVEVQIKGQRPVISAMYLSHEEPDHMIVEGQFLAGSKLWCFKGGEKAVHYLRLVDTAPKSKMATASLSSTFADADTPSTSDALPTKLCAKCGKLWPYSTDPRFKKPPLSIEVGYNIVNRNGVFVPDNQCKECTKAGDQASKTAREGRQRKKAKAGPAADAGGLMQSAVGIPGSLYVADSEAPTASVAVVDAASSSQIASDAHTTALGTLATEAALAQLTIFESRMCLHLPSRPEAVRLVLNSLRQQPEQERAAESHHKLTAHLPSGLLEDGSLWLQAQNKDGISEPIATPKYAVVAKQLPCQDQWKRFMYSPDLLRCAQWVDDPIAARAHRKSLQPQATSAHAGVSRNIDSHDGPADGQNSTTSFELLDLCKLGKWQDALQLVKSAGMVMQRDAEGCTCLHAVAQSASHDLSLDVLRDLEEAGGVKLVHARTRWGLHAMHFAAGNFTHGCQVLTRLLEYCNLPAYQGDGHVLAFKDARGCTPLHWAARLGNTEVIKLLLAAGADPNSKDRAEATPLHYAMVSPTPYRLKCIKSMLAWHPDPASRDDLPRADLEARDRNGQSPLHWLVGACHLTVHLLCIDLLMEHKAKVQAKDFLANTPLHIAAASSRLPAAVLRLEACGASLDTVNDRGDTVLHTAAGFGNCIQLACLTTKAKEAGTLSAALSCCNKAGYTALQLAVMVGWSDLSVRLLSELGQRQKFNSQLLSLLVRHGWRQEIGETLLRQALAHGVSLGSLWQSAQLLSQRRLKALDITKPPERSVSTFRSQLHLQFCNTVTDSNKQLRLKMVLRMLQCADSAGKLRKLLPEAMNFVPAERPPGLDARPQSNLISSESQTVSGVFDRCLDLPEYMQSYNWPIKTVDDTLLGLLEASKIHSDHMLGSLAMFHGAFAGHYWLVDGHQKLITLQLVLAFGLHWAKSQGASQAVLFDTLRHLLWAEHSEEAPSRWRLQLSQPDQGFMCANVLQSFLPVRYKWQAEASDTAELRPGDIGDAKRGADAWPIGSVGDWFSEEQGLGNTAWWCIYASAHRVQEVLIHEQQQHKLNMAAFLRHTLQRCHVVCCTFRDETAALNMMDNLRLETPVMDRIKTGMLQQLSETDNREVFIDRWNYAETVLGKSGFEDLFGYYKQLQEAAGDGPALSVLAYYLKAVTKDARNITHKAAAVKSCLTSVLQCAPILHWINSLGFATSMETAKSSGVKQEHVIKQEEVQQADTKLMHGHLPSVPSTTTEQGEGKVDEEVVAMDMSKDSKEDPKADPGGHQSAEFQTLKSLDEICRYLLLLPEKDWVCLALGFCLLEQGAAQRLAFFGCLEALQVLFWLTEATADIKQSRLKDIARTLLQKPCTLVDTTQIAQLSVQAAKLTDAEKSRFKAELRRSDLLRQDNIALAKYLLLRAEDRLSWADVSWCDLQVDQILPDQPYAKETGTLWRQDTLDSPSPTDPDCARQHWTSAQIQLARRSIGNLILLQASTPFTDTQRRQEFNDKKLDYVCRFKSELFPVSAAVIDALFFSCNHEYADRQTAYVACLDRIYKL